MRAEPSRRAFLETAGATVALGTLAMETHGADPPRQLKIAAVATVYHFLSHAYHIVGRFLDGFVIHEVEGFIDPDFDVVSLHGDIEIFGFHALETLQCMVERRDRKGKPQGAVAVTCLEGDAVWAAGERGVWSRRLLDAALGRSHTVNPGDIRRNTVDFRPPAGKDGLTRLRHPIAFVIEYADDLRATALILNGHVDDTTFACRLGGARPGVVSTLVYLPAPPGARFFDPLVLRIEDFFRTGRSPYPVERTLLTGGILDAALESRIRGHRRIETPDLAAIDYEAPADSGFIRTPIAGVAANPV